jgi:hypothetical protein
MLTVTVPARARLLSKLVRRKAAGGVALRFTRKTGGWRLRVDHARPDDKAITHEGRNVLLLDRAVSQAMTHMTLDVRETKAGPSLTLH